MLNLIKLGTGLRATGQILDVDFADSPPTRGFRSIDNRVGRDSIQPRRKRRSTPFEPREIRQRAMKDVGGKILRLVAITDPAHDIRIDPLEVILVKLSETTAVALRRLDQFPLRK